MSNYVSLGEAAKILGITTDALIGMLSRKEVFGYRDGSSWKFKQDEIERVRLDMAGDALDEKPEGSSVLGSDRRSGISGSKSGNASGTGSDLALDSDLKNALDEEMGSDVRLVPDSASDSGVKLVKNESPSDSGSSGVRLDAGSVEGGSDGEVDLGSDLRLVDASPESSGLDLLKNAPDSSVLDSQLGTKGGSSKSGSKSGTGSGSLDLAGELELAKDDEDDLLLGSDSGLSLGSESGINLMSPSDSGLSLEDEPLDLVGTGISGLNLGSESGSGSTGSGGSSKSAVGSDLGGELGSGALVDFEQGEEFQLTPSGAIETDEDSSSQVIELEDSASFDQAGGLPGADLGAVQEAGIGLEDVPGAAGAIVRGAADVPFVGWQVGLLVMILLIMGTAGILTTDIVRNLWQWEGETDYSSGLTSMLVNAINPK